MLIFDEKMRLEIAEEVDGYERWRTQDMNRQEFYDYFDKGGECENGRN